MPDIHDIKSDAYPSVSEAAKELAQAHCEEQTGHSNYEYVEEDQKSGIKEHMYCMDCGELLDIPEPDEDELRGDR